MDETETEMATTTTLKIETELRSATEPLGIAALAKRAGISNTTTRKAVAELVEAGRAVKGDDGKVSFVRESGEKPAGSAKPPKDDAKLRATMNARDAQLLDALAQVDDLSVAECAELLGVTTGAAKTALWRLCGRPVGGVAKTEALVIHTTRGRYGLANKSKSKATPKRTTKT